ncbi:MAG: 3-hydroxyacyl-CoA dehydrogenase family protein [Dehalococcoidia bacterium]|nr:3-hydroxyacyl-CoA dehydrogenase family protein [Dehalococcoidia bacterium]
MAGIPEIKTIGVMGGGVMGGGIAQVFALHGYNVLSRDISEELNAKTRETITTGRYGLEGGVERGKVTRQQADEAVSRISFITAVDDLKGVDLVVEAVPEDFELKKKVWAELEGIVRKDAIFATNTSGFSITKLADAVQRKDRFVGMHWFSPAPIMKMVEIVAGPETSDETVHAMVDLCERSEKVAVRVKDQPGAYGFVANRIYLAAVAEAQKILDEDLATVEDINKAMVYGYNWPVGPLAMIEGARKGWG